MGQPFLSCGCTICSISSNHTSQRALIMIPIPGNNVWAYPTVALYGFLFHPKICPVSGNQSSEVISGALAWGTVLGAEAGFEAIAGSFAVGCGDQFAENPHSPQAMLNSSLDTQKVPYFRSISQENDGFAETSFLSDHRRWRIGCNTGS